MIHHSIILQGLTFRFIIRSFFKSQDLTIQFNILNNVLYDKRVKHALIISFHRCIRNDTIAPIFHVGNQPFVLSSSINLISKSISHISTYQVSQPSKEGNGKVSLEWYRYLLDFQKNKFQDQISQTHSYYLISFTNSLICSITTRVNTLFMYTSSKESKPTYLSHKFHRKLYTFNYNQNLTLY